MTKPFRVVLISPYSHISAIGLRPISACLKQAGFESRMIFLPDIDEWLSAPHSHRQEYPPETLDQVCELCADADLIGIGVMSNFVGRARSLTEVIHTRLGLPVIWGGVHPTARPGECLQWADFVCVGEGEESVTELVGRMAAGQGVANIANIWLKSPGGQIVPNSVRPLNRSLASLPLPDYELSTQYILHEGHLQPLTPQLLAYYLLNFFAGGPKVAYMTCLTRGCPYKCTYCCENAMSQLYPNWRHLRRRSPEHLIAEINQARQVIPGLQVIMFLDSTFLAVSAAEIRRFSELYRAQVGLPFFMMATPNAVTQEKLTYLVDAGLQDVEMGIQTGSERIRRIFRRPEDNKQVLAAAQRLHSFRAQIPHPRYDLITDNPYETRNDQMETLQLLYKLPRPSHFYVFSLTFYPGTELYNQARTDGLIQDDELDVYPKNFGQLKPTYYNFVLWCIHRNLPRSLLWLLIQPLAFRLFDSRWMRSPLRLLWRWINDWRTQDTHRQYLRLLARLK